MAIERTEATGLDEFVGKVTELKFIKEGNYGSEYELLIKPEDDNLISDKAKTGVFHEFLRVPKTATEQTVPDGSVLDAYIREIESVLKDEAKKVNTVKDCLELLVGKKIKYRRKKLGRSYQGHEAADHWVPVTIEK